MLIWTKLLTKTDHFDKKTNYIIRENPANLLGNQGARPLFHIPDEIELWGDF